MLKILGGGFLLISVAMIGFLIYHATARGGGVTSWILAVIWLVATVLIIGAAYRGLLGRST